MPGRLLRRISASCEGHVPRSGRITQGCRGEQLINDERVRRAYLDGG